MTNTWADGDGLNAGCWRGFRYDRDRPRINDWQIDVETGAGIGGDSSHTDQRREEESFCFHNIFRLSFDDVCGNFALHHSRRVSNHLVTSVGKRRIHGPINGL
jgi:hypothetical protein